MWNPKYEAMDREALQKLQYLRLKQTLERVYQLVPHYRSSFKRAGLSRDIRSLEDLAKSPFTIKDDLRDNYPYGLFASDLGEVVRIHSPRAPPASPRWSAIPALT